MSDYDVLIIGAGQAGVPLAHAFAQAGKRTLLIEEKHIAGTCINEGCTPTKTMVASARVAYLVNRAADYGVKAGKTEVDLKKVRQRKRDIVESFRSSSERRIDAAENLDQILGTASFSGPKRVQVKTKDGRKEEFNAENIFINTGARPAVPALKGIEGVSYLNSTSIMELGEAPEHLLIIGGGYIGLEFGQMFRRFGSRVTIVQKGKQLLSREDEDVAEEISRILQEDGVDVRLNSVPTEVKQDAKGIKLDVRGEDGNQTIICSHLLVAAGRVPNTENLNLDKAGIRLNDRGFIRVNEKLETDAPGIYALGDVKGGPAFTHISYDDFRIIRTNLLENGNATIAGRMVPYTVFMDPQLGRVGMSEKEAKAKNIRYKSNTLPMNWVARALEIEESRGFMKVLIEEDTGQILGCAVLGIEGGEIMAIIQTAIMGKLHYSVLRDATFAHPTLAESLNNLFTGI
jgi:pyruvate/2-oxoglutarate dehydrogenase complex dihydrolipoamide dehydrogenase (E3) component